MKVLICDDDATSLGHLTLLLTKMGLEVISTRDSTDALVKLGSAHAPRMAILDWMMPGYSGIDICKQVRQNSTAISTYIILVTSRDQASDIAEGLDAGANDYVVKPFSPTELRARVQAGLRIIGLESELKTLTGLLPICAWCKNIREPDGSWVRMEEYVESNSYAQFSHGGCPECLEKLRKTGKPLSNP